jgi:hypothetical protein
MALSRLQTELFFYSAAHRIEHMHPLQAGVFRRKFRRDRRPGLPLESVWSFYPKYAWEIVSKHVRLAAHWIMIEWMLRRAKREEARRPYTDLALTPVLDNETEALEMFTHSEAARDAVAHIRKVDALTGRSAARRDARPLRQLA